MAIPVTFPDVNVVWYGGKQFDPNGEPVLDLPVYQLGPHNVSMWKLSAEELAEINNNGGYVLLDVLTLQPISPVFVGSHTSMQEMVFGPIQGTPVHPQDVAEMPQGSTLQTGGIPTFQISEATAQVRHTDPQHSRSANEWNERPEIPKET